MSRYWSSLVHKLTPYTPGEQPQIEKLIKLNTNENPYGPSPLVIEAIERANSESLRKYPDPNASKLKSAIADYYSNLSIEPSQVFVGNSSDEVLAHVFRGLLKKDKPLLFPDITYSFYPVYCGLFEIDYETVPLREDYSIGIDDFSIENGGIIFANPNAPTGMALTITQIESLAKTHTESVIVVDEAYIDFAQGEVKTAIELVNKYPNLLVTQTLSKSRNLAGLRVGLAIGSAELIEGLERIKNSFHPYALDSLAIEGASAAFVDRSYFDECRNKVIATRESFLAELVKLGFESLESSTNFVFTSHPQHDAKTLFEGLRKENIVVRYFDKQRLNQHLRISIGTDEEMSQCKQGLAKLVKS